MDPTDPLTLLRWANHQIRRGVSPDSINTWMAENGHGSLDDVKAATAQNAEAQRDLDVMSKTDQMWDFLKGTAGATGTFAAEAGNAATLGLLDEAVGVVSPETRDQMREHQEMRRERDPEAAIAGGLFGGLALPGMAAGRAVGGAATGLRAIGRGIGVGAAEGAAFGAGEAQGENVLEGAIIGGATGAAGGAAFGTATSLARVGQRALAGGRVGRLQERLIGTLPDTNRRGFFSRARKGPDVRSGDFATQRTARDAALREVGEGFDEIDRIGLSRGTQRAISKAVYETQEDIAALAFRGKGTLDLRKGKVPTTVGELRRLRRELDRGMYEMGDAAPPEMIRASDALHEILDDVPGFSEGNAAYRAQSSANAAWQMGASGSRRAGRMQLPRESSNVPSGLRYDIESLAPELQDEFRQGLRVRLMEELKDGVPSQDLVRAIRAQRGQANETALRQYWPNTDAGQKEFDAFLKEARQVWGRSELEEVLVNQSERTFAQTLIPRGR